VNTLAAVYGSVRYGRFWCPDPSLQYFFIGIGNLWKS
jgi:hypothetical protein